MIDLLDWFADHGVPNAPVARLIDELGIARSSFYDLMAVFAGSGVLEAVGRGTVGQGPLVLDAGLAATGLGRDWAAMERAVSDLAAGLRRPVRLWAADGTDLISILDAGASVARGRDGGRRQPLLSTPAGWLLAAAMPERRRRFLPPAEPARRQEAAAAVARLAPALADGIDVAFVRGFALRALRDPDATIRGVLAADLGEADPTEALAMLASWRGPA